VSLILVHNHPSGALEPSGQDLRLTQELKDLCARLGITLHDHLIAGGSGVYSIALGRTLP
ncbi:MAG TPA: JAB domain-containing protein, partial [Deltaproteobacteria bacterium]|nr:JAB domain-containing protein [Deltaproteobacteria bacterium]